MKDNSDFQKQQRDNKQRNKFILQLMLQQMTTNKATNLDLKTNVALNNTSATLFSVKQQVCWPEVLLHKTTKSQGEKIHKIVFQNTC